METIFCSRACMHAHIGKACKKSYLALCVSLCKARTRTRDQKHNQLRQKKERCRERNASYQHDVRQKVQRARHSPKSLRTEFRPRMTTLARRARMPKRSCVEHFVLPNPQTFVSRCTYHCDS